MNRRTTMRTTTVLLAAALGLTLAACGGGGTDSGDGTTDAPESALVIYSGRSESLVSDLLADFTEETGIEVSVRYAGTAELAAQILEEGDRSPAEIFFSQDAGALEALAAEGALTAIPAATTALVPEAYRSVDDLWVGTSGRARVLLYNDELVPAAEVPTSVLELTDPKWKGQVGIAPTNASFQTFVTAMRVSLGEEATAEWLAGLVANDVQTFDNNVAIRDAVDAGQISLGLANHYYWFEKAAEVGADNLAVQNRFLEPGDVGSFVNVAGVAVLPAGADDPSAQKFVDFLLSEKAQTFFAETTYEYPLVEGVAPAEGLPALEDLQGPEINLADLADLAGTQAALQEAGLL
jgi:iron(III) transport system substrate-binding protein